jgi:hypothetical protein
MNILTGHDHFDYRLVVAELEAVGSWLARIWHTP